LLKKLKKYIQNNIIVITIYNDYNGYMKTIHTEKAPAVVGPYSQAIEANGFLFCAGQIGLDPQTKEMVDGIENQTQQVMKNIQAVLEASGVSWNNVVKTTIYLANMTDYTKVNELYGQYFPENKPARSTIAVAELPRKALIEVEVIASV
jgi:2-iminobutanoate/2-iminopropanoate deaminase